MFPLENPVKNFDPLKFNHVYTHLYEFTHQVSFRTRLLYDYVTIISSDFIILLMHYLLFYIAQVEWNFHELFNWVKVAWILKILNMLGIRDSN